MQRETTFGDCTADWSYVRSAPGAITRFKRAAALRQLRPAPRSILLDAGDTAQGRWVALFLFCPAGTLNVSQLYTLERLAESTAQKLIICACSAAVDVPKELRGRANLLYWKALSGYDFSAYSIALHSIANCAPGSDVLMMNDSVFGPFVPFDTLWQDARWDLSGFTASSTWENHLQSYAFQLKNVTPDRMRHLGGIFPRKTAFNQYPGVVLNQETRFAATASRQMTVGARWYSAYNKNDPSLHHALALLEVGFPFLKKGLLSKHSDIYPAADVKAALLARSHPLEL